MPTTKEVIDQHLQSFSDKNLDRVLSDYTPDAVLFTPDQPLKGPDAMRPFFENLMTEFSRPGTSFSLLKEMYSNEYGYIAWVGETSANRYEGATDTFVVRDGKIVAQSFFATIIPKQ